VSFKTEDVADNLKNQNGFIPGIRPGKKTEEYLEYVVNRILVLGSAYLALVVPDARDRAHNLAITFYFGGTSILIIGRWAWTRCSRSSRICWRTSMRG
jgi:preprotein translocase subunit SecY